MACSKAEIEKEVKTYFDLIDKDKSGFIDSSEVEKLLLQYAQSKGKKVDPAKVKAEVSSFVTELDTNRDGKVSLKEFTDFAVQFFCP